MEMTLGKMQVDGGLFQIAVAQQDLNGAQIGAGFEQMSGKAVTQRVGDEPFSGCRPAGRLAGRRARRFSCRWAGRRYGGGCPETAIRWVFAAADANVHGAVPVALD